MIHAPRPLASPVVVALLVAGSLTLGGCGSHQSGRPASSSSYSDPAASLGAGAAADLVKHTCVASASGSWTFTGTVKNSTQQNSAYTFTLSLVQKVGSTVVLTHEVVKQVDAGQTATVTAKDFAAPKNSKNLACVVSTRAKRG